MPKTVLFFLLSFSVACVHFVGVLTDNPKSEIHSLRIDTRIRYQEMDHFGASDAWSGQFVGNWPVQKKEAIADLLFSNAMDDQGNPIGIGLSLWRINLGAGSAEQGAKSGIKDPWRRAPSFLDKNGKFDSERQKGQLWFARAAKERQVPYLLAFSNSPPVWLTRNGKAYADSGNQSNLPSANQGAFAGFLAASLKGLKEEGLPIDYVSPVNEPQWDWKDGGQEGTPFWNTEIAGIVRFLNASLDENELDTQIDIAEAGQIEYLYSKHNRPGRSNQITDFFDRESKNYLGDLTHISQAISGHSYFTTSPFPQAVRKRELLTQAIQQVPGLKYWMSEYCILGDNEGEISGSGKDLGINPALYMARVIHTDLVTAQASAWHWWLAISPYDYKDGLVYVSKSETDGDFEESKMLWTLGNYSRFIRPGYQRISAILDEQDSQNKELLASAYLNPDTGDLVLVLVNASEYELKIALLEAGSAYASRQWYGYLTDENHDLAYQEIPSAKSVRIPARSILTLTTQSL